MVRNESDIIELCVRHAAHLASEVVVMDHLSDDGTYQILQRLASELANLTLSRLTDLRYRQAKYTTSAVRELIRRRPDVEYVVPLDADEFLPFSSAADVLEYFRANVPIDSCGLMPWVTFCPRESNTHLSRENLKSSFRALEREGNRVFKVVIGSKFGKTCRVKFGNHGAKRWGKNPEYVILDRSLQHIPIRSERQAIRKFVLGEHAMSLSALRRKKGWHWNKLSEKIRRSGFSLDDGEVLDIAKSYACRGMSPPYPELVEEPTLILAKGLEATCSHSPDINLLSDFDGFIHRLLERQRRPRLVR